MTNYDEQFNLRKRHPLSKVYLYANELQSYITRLTSKASLDISYGQSQGERIDVFPAVESNSPIFVFIHGGYFRALDKRQYSFIAKPFVRRGCTVVSVNYDLAPKVRVKEIVDQNIKAFLWIYQNISRWNGNPQNIVLCGHSVGAFLAAKILEYEWDQQIRHGISGVVLLSGLYDLTTMRQSYLNKSLRLSEEDVEVLSPMFGHVENFPHALIAVGENETDEFIRQSKDYAKKVEAANLSYEFMLLKNKNHYTVARMLSRRNNGLTKKIMSLFGQREINM